MTFIQNTKNFFKKKPVRIFIAIIIIGSIMTGIAFGIIFLFRTIQDPCAKIEGTTWDKDLQKCVDNNCNNICASNINGKEVGQCLDNYCNYSTDEMTYEFDPDTCQCKATCSDPEKTAKTSSGDLTTDMYQDTATGEYKPIHPLTCGFDCQFNNNKICLNSTDKCAISIDKNGYVTSLTRNQQFNNCIPESYVSNFEFCSTDENIVCDTRNNFICSNSEEPITVQGDSYNFKYQTNTYCADNNKCGSQSHHSNYEIICRLPHNGNSFPEDCTSPDGGTHGNCAPNSSLEEKGIILAGTCDNKNDFSQHHSHCRDISKVGEYKYDIKNNTYDKTIYFADLYDNYVGISCNQPQCIEACKTGNTPQCKIDNLDATAKWYCKLGNQSNCSHTNTSGQVVSCDENAPVSMGEVNNNTVSNAITNYEILCCDPSQAATLGNRNNFCCPIPTVTENGEKLCVNSSKYPPDASWSELPIISCSRHEDCRKPAYQASLVEALNKSIHPSSKEEYGAQCSHREKSTYSNLYCNIPKGGKMGTCGFFAGYVDKVTSNQSNPEYKAYWMVGNDHDKSTSEAISIVGKTNWSTPFQPKRGYGGVQGQLIMCKQNNDENQPGVFGNYNVTTGASVPMGTQDYTSKAIAIKKDGPVTTMECLKHANDAGVLKAYFKEDSGGSYNTSGIEIDQKTCNYTADCRGSLGTPLTNGSNLEWNFTPLDVHNNGNQIITQDGSSSGEIIKFATIPKYLYSQFGNDSGACTFANASQSLCEDKYIPSAWENYHLDDNFVNLCEWKQGFGCVSRKDHLPKYILRGTSKHNKQYCESGVKMDINGAVCCVDENDTCK